MNDVPRSHVLRRKLAPRPSTPPEDAAAEARGPAAALVRSFARAVSAAAPLVAEDGSLHRRRASLAELLDTVDPEAFVALLTIEGQGPGLAVVDQDGFVTIIEAMTVGRLAARPPQARRPTATDAALLGGLLNAALAGLGADDPAAALRIERAVPDHRLLPVLLDDGDYDLVALTATLVAGAVTRPLRAMLALPRHASATSGPSEPPETDTARWSGALESAVMQAPVVLRAELGRVTLPLAEVLGLGIGSTLTFPLSNLEEVRLIALDGQNPATGRLGQTRGMRAVRLTQPPGANAPLPMDPVQPPLASATAMQTVPTAEPG
ncbi:MAG: FliM/FliN family flagellar motor switch protein [Rhodobacter sp.]|nr:FliM/FliN family flagellar motor switch protein [Rhodobacter sp.]